LSDAGPGDLVVPAGPGLPGGLVLPAGELTERFSRSGGPGGQGVNTTDSRVELRWDLAGSAALSDEQRDRLRERLAGRLVDGSLTIVASQRRSQLQNRQAARARLAALVGEALAPVPAARRDTRPSRAARQRRLEAKRHRGEVKAMRGRIRPD
jgi:ribosome-associated protein